MDRFELVPLSPHRLLVWDLLRDTDGYYLNHHVFLVDFTTVESLRERLAGQGARKPSYVALTLFAMSRVVPRHRVFNSYLRTFPLTRLALFEGVDIAYTLEKIGHDGQPVLSLSILERCDELGLAGFLEEFERRKRAPLAGLEYHRVLRTFLAVPAFLRVALFKLFCKPFPATMRKIGGTVAFTSVGKHGVDITTPLSPKSLCVSLGAVRERPLVREGRVVAAPSAYVTLTYDHRVADGRDCARLGSDLKRFMETGLGDLSLEGP